MHCQVEKDRVDQSGLLPLLIRIYQIVNQPICGVELKRLHMLHAVELPAPDQFLDEGVIQRRVGRVGKTPDVNELSLCAVRVPSGIRPLVSHSAFALKAVVESTGAAKICQRVRPEIVPEFFHTVAPCTVGFLTRGRLIAVVKFKAAI